jgi:tetratricopeptide (TPR) repeat protein
MEELDETQITKALHEDASLTVDERVLLRCRLSRELEEKGDYESAAEILQPYFQRIGQRPAIDGLLLVAGAELLLRAGTLTGWLGNLKQIENAQENAKDLIGESLTKFSELGLTAKATEAQIELAHCYWREGGFDEARVLLDQALAQTGEETSELKLVALLRKALVESSATRFNNSLKILLDNSALFDASQNDTLKGRFHNELAYNFQSLSSAENRADYMDRALVEFTAAAFHFEQAGHTRYRAHVENNLGLLFYMLGRYDEAHEHLDRARELYPALKNAVYSAIVDETRARVFIAQDRFEEAESAARSACQIFERAGELAQLSEALTTLGRAQARTGDRDQGSEAGRELRESSAQETLEEAARVAEQSGNVENAGLALLTMIEELHDRLSSSELRSCYQRADELLARSQHPETLARLRRAARRIVDGPTQSPAVSSSVTELLSEFQKRHEKQVEFTADALAAMERFFFKDNAQTLSSIIDETIKAVQNGEVITEEAVEVVALRGQAPRGNFAQPWADFSLKGELREPEKRFIELALKAAAGRISIAARLLGFNHNELLTSIIKSRYPDLLAVRKPTIPRRRSIIRKPQPKK